MAGVRRGAGVVLRYLTPLFLIAILVQIFLAGSGIFGIEEGETVDEASSLDLHRDFGWTFSHLGGLLLLLVALLWWPRNKRLLGMYVVAAIALIVQPFLAEGGQWVGAFHPLNGILILGLLGYLSSLWWRRGGEGMADAADARKT